MASPRGLPISSFILLTLFTFLPNPATSLRTSFIKLPGSDGSRSSAADTYCESWRLAAETNNAGTWDVIPSTCVDSVAGYLNGDQYGSDYGVIADYALAFAKTVQVSGDGKDVWIFDIDETLLTNLDYYKAHGYGYDLFIIGRRILICFKSTVLMILSYISNRNLLAYSMVSAFRFGFLFKIPVLFVIASFFLAYRPVRFEFFFFWLIISLNRIIWNGLRI